jgi:hypothetical protein
LYITHGPVGGLGDHAHVVGDEEDRHALFLLKILDELENLRLDRDVQRRAGLREGKAGILVEFQ